MKAFVEQLERGASIYCRSIQKIADKNKNVVYIWLSTYATHVYVLILRQGRGKQQYRVEKYLCLQGSRCFEEVVIIFIVIIWRLRNIII